MQVTTRQSRTFFFATSRDLEVLPWDAVLSVDYSARRIKVKDVEASQLAPPESLKKKVLLSEIDDALVLDLKHHRVARANGLLLKRGEWQVAA